MSQAIITKFIGPTNHRGSRVIAKCDAGTLVWPWDHAKNIQENHDAAAEALIKKLHWQGPTERGSLPESMGGGYVYVFLPGSYAAREGMKRK